MGCLLFDGVDDKLKWTTLASALANASDGAWTMACLVKRVAMGEHGIAYLESGGGTAAEAGLTFAGADNKAYIDIDGGEIFPTAFTSTANPYLLVVSKGAGSATPRLAWKLGSGGAWTHENADAALADQITSNALEIGAWTGNDPISAWVGVVAFWEGAMSDANKEALDNNWRTSDLWTSAHGTPVFLAELNVAGASVVDLAGNATTLAATGTTLDAGETLNSWNFDGTGVVVPGANAPTQRSRGFKLLQMNDAEDEGRFNELDVRNWWRNSLALA